MKIENKVQIMLEKDTHFFGVMFMVGLSEFQNQELKDFIKRSVKPIHHVVWMGGKRHANAFKIKQI